ncbi:UNVERIFIED_CONTAM: hypothetical protein GTU68_041459, partial [Idotea baltica]|nr:hypothetical protein [Idotea baltica]
MKIEKYNIIIVGGGHASLETAFVSATLGLKVLLLSQNVDTIGQLSCNPSMGGLGKSNLIKEIDVLGGLIGRVSDISSIQNTLLNTNKGYSVQAIRVQIDQYIYKRYVRKLLGRQKNLIIIQQCVNSILIDNFIIKGLQTTLNTFFYGSIVIIATGTFLQGKICVGHQIQIGGRLNSIFSSKLATQLKRLPLHSGRLKTGTPPKILKKSVNFSLLKRHYTLPNVYLNFSLLYKKYNRLNTFSCFKTQTNYLTHNVILQYLDSAIVYTNIINSIGPRYCPSIEDKVIRFSSKDSHNIFIESEGLDNFEIYPNGIATSLPFSIQLKFLHTIIGFNYASIVRMGYAIEYNFFDPQDLRKTLEVKYISNLFFAGQINGTTGYEEAAAQGLIAGINSFLLIKKKKGIILKESCSYIGLLIHDIVHQGIKEPYRMFTYRAENRIFLREDNLQTRL